MRRGRQFGTEMTPEDALFDRLHSAEKVVPTASTIGSPEESYVRSKGEPDSSKPVTLRNLFTHPDAHPITLDFAMMKAFGEDWFGWQAETLWDEIRDEFGSQLSELCKQKIRALQACHVSVLPWKAWQVFEKVAHAFNGTLPNFSIVQMLDLEELFATVDMLAFTRKEKFSDEVKLYMAGTVLHEDVFFVPAPLDFLQMEVSQPHYHCNDCGNEEPALFHDGFCSACTERMHPEQGLTLEPRQELVNQGLGKNTTIVPRYDHQAIAKRWEEVKALPFSEFKPDEDRMEDVQVRQLLLARDYMNIRRKQLAEQLTALKPWMGAS
jgi:hypothetical protein